MIYVNGKEMQQQNLLIAELLENLELNQDLIVVEVNQEIVQKAHYTKQLLSAGDRIEIVRFVGGG
jgi:thiamine biosynthesis protein ThiS